MTSFDRSRGCPMCENDPEIACSHCDGSGHTLPPQGAAPKFKDLVNRTMSDESQERARIKTEKMLNEMAEPRSAEEFAKIDWPGAIGDSMYAKYARQFAEAYAQSIREQLAAQKELYELRLENKQSELDEADKAIEILQAKLSAIREKLAAVVRANKILADTSVSIDNERRTAEAAILSAQKEIQELRAKYEKKS
jgi:hypothetical protein